MSEQWQWKAQWLEKNSDYYTHTHTHMHSSSCFNMDTQTVSTQSITLDIQVGIQFIIY